MNLKSLMTVTLSRYRQTIFILIVGILGISVMQDALASTYQVGVLDQSSIACNPPSLSFGSSPVSGSWSNNGGGTSTSSASAFANSGKLGGYATASSTGVLLGGGASIASCFRAEIVIDDIVISGPGTEVLTTVSADLAGSILGTTTTVGSVTGQVAATMQVQMSNGGMLLSPLLTFDTGEIFGTSINLNVNTTLTTAAFNAPVNQAFSVKLTLFGGAQTIASRGRATDGTILDSPGTADLLVDFLNTMNFTTNGNVFALPAGFTANSVSGNIVDNQFAVPLPSALYLFGSGIIGLIGFARRKKV